jgi:hypothetical protein
MGVILHFDENGIKGARWFTRIESLSSSVIADDDGGGSIVAHIIASH